MLFQAVKKMARFELPLLKHGMTLCVCLPWLCLVPGVELGTAGKDIMVHITFFPIGAEVLQNILHDSSDSWDCAEQFMNYDMVGWGNRSGVSTEYWGPNG